MPWLSDSAPLVDRLPWSRMRPPVPSEAAPGTIRKELAESIEANTVHGSDSDENAAIEIAYFFKPEEIVG